MKYNVLEIYLNKYLEQINSYFNIRHEQSKAVRCIECNVVLLTNENLSNRYILLLHNMY